MPCNCTQLFCDKKFVLCWIPGIDGACIRIRRLFNSTINYRANVFIKWTIFIYVGKIKCFECDSATYDFPLSCFCYVMGYNQGDHTGKVFSHFILRLFCKVVVSGHLQDYLALHYELNHCICLYTCQIWWRL